jgi:hypothetical protein
MLWPQKSCILKQLKKTSLYYPYTITDNTFLYTLLSMYCLTLLMVRLVVHCRTLNNDYYDCNTADLKYIRLFSVRMSTQDDIKFKKHFR